MFILVSFQGRTDQKTAPPAMVFSELDLIEMFKHNQQDTPPQTDLGFRFYCIDTPEADLFFSLLGITQDHPAATLSISEDTDGFVFVNRLPANLIFSAPPRAKKT